MAMHGTPAHKAMMRKQGGKKMPPGMMAEHRAPPFGSKAAKASKTKKA